MAEETDARCGNSASNKPKRLVKTLFVPENDDESRLAAKLAGRVSATNLSPSPVSERDMFTFVLYADNEGKTLIAPQVVIHQNDDEAVLAADLTKAVAAILGLKKEHSEMLRVTLTGFCLTPPVKKLAQEYGILLRDSYLSKSWHEFETASAKLSQAVAERRAAWSRVFKMSPNVTGIDVCVTLSHYWFTVKWTGSNKQLVAPNVFVKKQVDTQDMSRELVQQVAMLADNTNCKTIKLTLKSPAGPEVSTPLFRLSSDQNRTVPEFFQLGQELKTQWELLDAHTRRQLLETPVKPLELFLSAHSPVALAIDALYQCYNRNMEVHYWYSSHMDTKLREHPKVALTAIQLDKHFHCLSKLVPRHLLSDKQFVLQALAVGKKIGICGAVFKWADAKLKDDVDVVTTAVKFEGRLLQHMSETMRASKSVVLAAVSNDLSAIKYASSELQSDPDVLRVCSN